MTECVPQLSLDFHPQRRADVRFDGPDLSSDAGCLLLRGADDSLDLSARIAPLIPDTRDPLRVVHPRLQQVRQRLYQIAQGYEDCNDATIMRNDPALKLSCDQLPQAGTSELSSQPTLSRLENAADAQANTALQGLMMDLFVEDLPANTTRITLDVDGTMLETHGAQQLALFSGHYECQGYFPLSIWDRHGRLICVHLRQGTAPDSTDALPLLTRLIGKIRARFPLVRLFVRGDGAFSMPVLMDGLDALSQRMSPIHFLFGIRSNTRLAAPAQALRERMQGWKSGMRRYQEFKYAADSWPKQRRIIARHEVNGDGEVVSRYVVTSSPWYNARRMYRWYCRRGQAENWIKDFKLGTQAERMSCWLFEANQFRLQMHGFAYVLLYRIREHLGIVDRSQRRITPQTLRMRLLKVACRLRQSVRRVLIELPASFAQASQFRGVLAGLHGAPAT